MAKHKLAIMAGDGIGPEVMEATLLILRAVEQKFNHNFILEHCLVGGAAYDRYETHLPEESIKKAKQCDSILFGSVGGPVNLADTPKWKDCERNSILELRKSFQFNVNLRPITVFPSISNLSPLKEAKSIDFIIVRELLGDLYFGEHKSFKDVEGKRVASDTALYTEDQIAQCTKAAAKLALKRGKKLCLVHKANVLEISRLWVQVANEVIKEFPEISFHEMLVDNCAMQMVLNPAQFDVILTSNLFGDILSDLGAALVGSLGVTPSASLNNAGFGLFEPSGGSAPDIAGKGIANPLAQILSLALLIEMQFDMPIEAKAIRLAANKCLESGIMTADLTRNNPVSTQQFAQHIAESI